MKKFIYLLCALAICISPAVAQSFVTGVIPQYAGGIVTATTGSTVNNASINSQGNFTIPVPSNPTQHVMTFTPPSNTPYQPFNMTITAGPGTTNITAQIQAVVPQIGINLGILNASAVATDENGNAIPGSASGGAIFPSMPGVVYNTSTSAARNATVSDLPVLKQSSTFWCFGDSFMQGTGVSNPAQQSGCGLLAMSTPAANFNYGAAGWTAPQIVPRLFSLFAADPSLPSTTFLDAGANDGTGDTCGGTTTSGCALNYKLTMLAGAAWSSIPNSYRLYASQASATGSWSSDSTLGIYQSQLYLAQGNALSSSSNAAALTFSVPSSPSPIVGITYIVTNGQTGNFTVSVDGTLRTDACSGSTVFSSGPCSAVALLGSSSSFFRQEFAVTSGIAHTVVVTKTNAAMSDVTSVDWIPPTANTNTNAVFLMGPNAAYGNAATYDALAQSVASQLKADGLPVFGVSQISGTPGVNATSDISQTATVNCSASNQSEHPNTCGYANMAATVQNVAIANNYVFTSFQANYLAAVGRFASAISVNSNTSSRTTAYSNMNAGGTLGIGVDFYEAPNNVLGIGFGQDQSTGLPFSGSVIQKSFASSWWHCFQYVPGGNNTTNDEAAYVSKWCVDYTTGNTVSLGVTGYAIGTAIASSSTIAPTAGLTHITGTAAIATITPPTNFTATSGGCITLWPDAAFQWTNAGNIVTAAATAVVNHPLRACWGGTSWALN